MEFSSTWLCRVLSNNRQTDSVEFKAIVQRRSGVMSPVTESPSPVVSFGTGKISNTALADSLVERRH